MSHAPPPFRFQLILDQPYEMAQIEPLLRAGVDCLQIRIGNLTTRELLSYANGVVSLAHSHNVPVLVNGRVDVALASEATGVQLPGHGIPLPLARPIARGLLLGSSVHSSQEAKTAMQGGADFITFGHIFASSSHPGEAPRGLAALRDVVHLAGSDCPVVAIGGIERNNVEDVFAAGASAVALIGAVWRASCRVSTVQQIRERIDRCISN